MWASERVGPETVFRVGDRIRFAIESSVSGYLYIFSREMRSDGTLGPPDMHFPETEGENNFIVPNLPFDFPDRRDRTPYRKFGALEKGYVGDIVTVIVSPKPLTGLVRNPDGKLNRPDILSELESGSEVELFARADNEDPVYTTSEADAACGQKTRGLEKEKPNDPCGENARQLTKDDPYPQSIYRIKSYSGKPAVAFVKLAVK